MCGWESDDPGDYTRLTPMELRICAHVGKVIQAGAVMHGSNAGVGPCSRVNADDATLNIQGKETECAASKLLNVCWPMQDGPDDGTDVGFSYGVRSSRIDKGKGYLMLRPAANGRKGDRRDIPFVLVEKLGKDLFHFAGWRVAGDAMDAHVIVEKPGCDPLYYVPQRFLNPSRAELLRLFPPRQTCG